MNSIYDLIKLNYNIIDTIKNIQKKINTLNNKLSKNNLITDKNNTSYNYININLNHLILSNDNFLNTQLLNNKLQKLSQNNSFFEIAYILSNLVIKKYPTYRPSELDDIIHGNYCWLKKKANNIGYWGWKLILCTNVSIDNKLLPSQLKELANKPEINLYLKNINLLFNKYLIIPITNQIKNIVKNNKIKYYQNQIAKKLGLDKIEILFNSKKGYIISEIISKMEDQDIITHYYYKNKKYLQSSYLFDKEFQPGLYKSPRCKLSKPQLFCIQIIEQFLQDNHLLENLSLQDEFLIKDNIYNNSKFKAYPRIDIVLINKKTNKLVLAIESDGKQHDEIVPHFQRNGICDLNKQKIRDIKKDEWIYKNTNFKCIRIKDVYYKNGIKYEPTGLEKKIYLLKKLNSFLIYYKFI